MLNLRILPTSAASMIGLAIGSHAAATTTQADARAFVNGTSVTQSVTAGAEGAEASAEQVVPSPYGDVFVSAQAGSYPGRLRAPPRAGPCPSRPPAGAQENLGRPCVFLRAAGEARTTGAPGGLQGSASASWADAFAITADGHAPLETGTFSGRIDVIGELLTELAGRVYSDTQIYATVDIFPGTGEDGGRTVPSGSARRLVGYDIPGIHTGDENFTLVFTGVPFTFGQRIDVILGLSVFADVNAIDAGSTGRAVADHGHTMT